MHFERTKENLKKSFIEAFGQEIGKLHAKGIFHGDLRLGNVLAQEKENDWQFFYLDNERTRKFNKIPDRLRIKNLVQINMHRTETITDADRELFYEIYIKINQIEYNLAKKVIQKTNSRLSKGLDKSK